MTHPINRFLGKRGLEILVLILLAFRILAFCGPYHWFADLLSNFLFQYLALGFLLGCIMARLKSWVYCAVAFLIAAVSLVQVAGSTYYVARMNAPYPGFKMAQFNAQSTNDSYNDIRLWIYENRNDIDAVVLQEATEGLAGELRSLSSFYPYQIDDARDDESGTVVLSKYPFLSKQIFEIKYASVTTRALHMNIDAMNMSQPISLYILRATKPSNASDRAASLFEFDTMAAKIRADKSAHIIFAGDWGITPYSTLYKHIQAATGLYEPRNAALPVPTWPASGAPWLMQLPVDHLMTNGTLRLQTQDFGPALGSDHVPVISNFITQ